MEQTDRWKSTHKIFIFFLQKNGLVIHLLKTSVKLGSSFVLGVGGRRAVDSLAMMDNDVPPSADLQL